MKVRLADGLKRWSHEDFSIARGEVVDCEKDVFLAAMGRLVEVKESKDGIVKKKGGM